eukprot:CAMPEP_0198291226 /NCGR_PEP_ID=MMETSP1449-20131203/8822_1 /TAXON_ID=420275 /ORGANISM="Attheya septentrionalis, Strain CCMP2084" /LENGTH=504 /DNA_ID=CAMNT_0043989833 /DNA_START=239 /DNA_END=1753 /DNA_ORIENTATION=-
MAWGAGSSTLKSCSALLAKVESGDPKLTDLVILPHPLKEFNPDDANRLAKALLSNETCKLTGLHIPHDLSQSLDAVEAIGQSIVVVHHPSEQDGNTRLGLQDIDIGNRTFGDDGAASLSRGIERQRRNLTAENESSVVTTTTLEVLSLSERGIGCVGMDALGSALAPSQRLRRIDLSGNSGEDDDACPVESFCSAALHSKSEVSSPFPLLSDLDLSNCSICCRRGDPLEAVSKLLTVMHEDAKGHQVELTKKQMHLSLSGNPLFESLDENQPSWSPLMKLVADGVITKLDLSKVSFGTCAMPFMENLALSLSQSTCRLESLNLSACRLDGTIIQVLAASIHNNRSLKELNLAGNNIGSDGATALGVALGSDSSSEHGGTNTTLTTLDMSGTKSLALGASALLKCSNLTSLRLFDNSLLDGFDQLIPLIKSNMSLLQLDLGGNNVLQNELVLLLDEIAASDSKLILLEIGGNKSGNAVIEAVDRLQLIKPSLDIAHDKPQSPATQ